MERLVRAFSTTLLAAIVAIFASTGFAQNFGQAVGSSAGAGAADPYAIYYNGVANDAPAANLFTGYQTTFEGAGEFEYASHKPNGHGPSASASTPSASSTSIYSGSWRAVVDKSEQRMYVYRNGRLIHKWKVSTGKAGHRTPNGHYRANANRIYRHYTSRKYNAPMPYSVFFYHGYAVHGTYATSRLGRPASRGCVRLSNSNARKFYNIARAQRSNLKIQIKS